MTTEKEIRKVKLDKSANLEITYDEIIHHDNGNVVINKVTVKDGHKVHNDLKEAFAALRVHLVLICEQTDISPEETDEGNPSFTESNLLDRFKVTGFVTSVGDEPGITLLGNREIELGTLNIIAPPVRYEESGYKYSQALRDDANTAIGEVHEYLLGKYAPEVQLSLEVEFEEELT